MVSIIIICHLEQFLFSNYCSKGSLQNKPKRLKVAKEDQRLIGSMVNGLDGQ